jgi:hypothetical protein
MSLQGVQASGRTVDPGSERSMNFDGAGYEPFSDGLHAYVGGSAETALTALFLAAVAHTEHRITWLEQEAKAKSRAAQRVRFWSLVLIPVGMLAPIVVSILLQLHEPFDAAAQDRTTWLGYVVTPENAQIGYVLLAAAAALIVYDRFLASHGSWVGLRQAQAQLYVLLSQFRVTWTELQGRPVAAGSNYNREAELTRAVYEFLQRVEMIAEGETRKGARRSAGLSEDGDGRGLRKPPD